MAKDCTRHIRMKWSSQFIVLCFSFLSVAILYAEGMECYIEDTLCIPIPDKRTDYIKNELLLLFPKGYPKEKQRRVLAQYKLDEISISELESLEISISKTNTNGQDALELREKINRLAEEMEAATNNIYESTFTTLDKADTQQQGRYPHAITGAGQALDYSTGKGILIGLIDGPVDVKHKAYQGRVEQIDLIPNRPESIAYLLHGSAMAGVLIANNPQIGIAPDAKLLSISAFMATPKGKSSSSSERVAKAIDIAIKRKVDILNLSFAGGKDPLVSRMVRKALDKGIFVIASCGNNASKKPAFPAALEGVIAVTAVNYQKEIYPQANTGKYIDVAAPGVGVLTTAPGGRYDFSTGTSIATAHVSASLALLLAKKTNIQRDLLSDTALDLGQPGYDNAYGNGLINVMNAMQRLLR